MLISWEDTDPSGIPKDGGLSGGSAYETSYAERGLLIGSREYDSRSSMGRPRLERPLVAIEGEYGDTEGDEIGSIALSILGTLSLVGGALIHLSCSRTIGLSR